MELKAEASISGSPEVPGVGVQKVSFYPSGGIWSPLHLRTHRGKPKEGPAGCPGQRGHSFTLFHQPNGCLQHDGLHGIG